MPQLVKLRVAIGVVVVESLALFHLWLSRGVVLFSEPADDKQLIAQVVLKRDFPYAGVFAYLEVRVSRTGSLRQRHFLLADDQFQDLVRDIRSLEWHENAVALDIGGTYSGPDAFDVTHE